MHDDQTRWLDTLATLAAGRAPTDDDALVLAFVVGDLVEGRGRRAPDMMRHGDAWLAVLDRAPSLSPSTIEVLLALGARVPPGEPMRGLVQLLRAALSEGELAARVRALSTAAEPERRAAAQSLAYWIQG